VSIHPSFTKIANTGIIVTCAGSIIVEITITNSVLRPFQSIFDSPYATRLHERIEPTTQSTEMISVFRSCWKNGMNVRPRE